MPKAPHSLRGGVLYQVEEGRWIVTLIGVGRDYHPPTDEAGFLNFAHSLHSPDIYEAIKDAQPLSPIYCYQRTENRWRHYERLSRFPEAGKSTVTRQVAQTLGLLYLDTGAMYRALTWLVLHRGIAVEDEGAIAILAEQCQIQLTTSNNLNSQLKFASMSAMSPQSFALQQ